MERKQFLRTVPLAVGLLLLAALAGVGGSFASPPRSAGAAAQQVTSYRVTIRVNTAYASGPFYGHSTVSADVTARGGPTSFTGSIGVGWDSLQYGSNQPECTLTPTTKSGSFEVTVERVSDSQIKVTWGGNPVSRAHLHCDTDSGPVDSEGPIIEPFRNAEPSTFTLPAAGGTQRISGGYTINARHDESTGTITVTANQCDTAATKVTNVSTRTGAPTNLSDLAGRNLQPGQVITADEDVQLDFADGSVFRFTKGSRYAIADCERPRTDLPFKIRMSLLLGKLWSSVTKVFGREVEIDGCSLGYCHATGVRGTVFWISIQRGVEAVHVYQGAIWLQRRQGSRLVGQRWIVKAGQTATWKQGAPTIRRTGGTSTKPTWSFGP